MECPPQSTPAPAPPVATEPAAEPDTLSEPSFEDRYWNFSTLPRNLIPHTLQDAPALHVFPPAYPSFYERIRTRPEARYALPSPRHCLTEATHLLMEQAGSVQFRASTETLQNMVARVLPPMYAALGQVDKSRADFALRMWHNDLRTQESALWDTDSFITDNPLTSYAQRAGPTPPGHHEVRQAWLPDGERAITVTLLASPLSHLISDLLRDIKPTVPSSHLVDSIFFGRKGPAVVGLRRPLNFDEDAWDDIAKFLIRVSLLSPEDWRSLVECLHGGNDGISLTRTAYERIVADADLTSVWAPLLAQIFERLHATRSRYLLLTDYDRYGLFTLDERASLSVSRLFYRDMSHLPAPDGDLDPDYREPPVIVMEVILALVMLAHPVPDPESLWVDMTAMYKQKRAKERARREEGIARSSARVSAPSPPSRATEARLTLTLNPSVFVCTTVPNYTVLPRCGEVCATLEQPCSTFELVSTIAKYSDDLDCDFDGSLDEDTPPSLSWSVTSDDSSVDMRVAEEAEDSYIELTLESFIDSGRTWDAYKATPSAQVPGRTYRLPAVAKHVELQSLESYQEACAEYPELGRVLSAVGQEADMLRMLGRVVPGIAPILYALWTWVADDHILMAMEDCGNVVTLQPKELELESKDEILATYKRLHGAGIVHGHVCRRHILRDGQGRLRLVDWEEGYKIPAKKCLEFPLQFQV